LSVEIGMKYEARELVTMEKSAKAMGSGSLPVYATPAMSCLMEKAAAQLLEAQAEPGWTSVGGAISIRHEAPTPVGAAVRAEAEVTAAEGRRVEFKVAAFDEAGQIGRGTHTRFMVQAEPFLAKAGERRDGGK